jgi:hypothetical protein
MGLRGTARVGTASKPDVRGLYIRHKLRRGSELWTRVQKRLKKAGDNYAGRPMRWPAQRASSIR